MFRTLDDYKKKVDEKKEKDNRKTTDSYAGGKSSGIAIENPDDNKTENNSKQGNKEGFDKTTNKLYLKVYKNGFIVNDGPFRSLSDDKNKKFMAEVDKGYIPNELVKQGYKDWGIALENHKNEEYKEPIPEKKFEAFVGTGKSLGNVTTQGLAVNKNVTNNVDRSRPTCNVNIRLFNGETVNQEFNWTSTLGDIMRFVQRVSGSGNFQLLDGFPPKPITEVNKTIEELKLQGSTWTQRIG